MSSSDNSTLALIVEHGLTVRQIPMCVVNRWGMRPKHVLKDNETIVTVNGREFIETRRIPTHAGKWMAKRCTHSDASVVWNIKRDNLSESLHEAVLKASQTTQD